MHAGMYLRLCVVAIEHAAYSNISYKLTFALEDWKKNVVGMTGHQDDSECKDQLGYTQDCKYTRKMIS